MTTKLNVFEAINASSEGRCNADNAGNNTKRLCHSEGEWRLWVDAENSPNVSFDSSAAALSNHNRARSKGGGEPFDPGKTVSADRRSMEASSFVGTPQFVATLGRAVPLPQRR